METSTAIALLLVVAVLAGVAYVALRPPPTMNVTNEAAMSEGAQYIQAIGGLIGNVGGAVGTIIGGVGTGVGNAASGAAAGASK